MASHKPRVTSSQVTRQRELESIDNQLRYMWLLYRRWHRTGQTDTSGQGPLEALESIDSLLDRRHELIAGRQGELTRSYDVASAAEWGSADTGQTA
jgi:hypothetical protein